MKRTEFSDENMKRRFAKVEISLSRFHLSGSPRRSECIPILRSTKSTNEEAIIKGKDTLRSLAMDRLYKWWITHTTNCLHNPASTKPNFASECMSEHEASYFASCWQTSVLPFIVGYHDQPSPVSITWFFHYRDIHINETIYSNKHLNYKL